MNKTSDPIRDVPIVVMSYEAASKKADKIRGHFNVIVADEAHYLKNRDSQRSKNLVPVLQESKRIILMSGTPMINRPVEIFNLLHILRPDCFSSFKDYT